MTSSCRDTVRFGTYERPFVRAPARTGSDREARAAQPHPDVPDGRRICRTPTARSARTKPRTSRPGRAAAPRCSSSARVGRVPRGYERRAACRRRPTTSSPPGLTRSRRPRAPPRRAHRRAAHPQGPHRAARRRRRASDARAVRPAAAGRPTRCSAMVTAAESAAMMAPFTTAERRSSSTSVATEDDLACGRSPTSSRPPIGACAPASTASSSTPATATSSTSSCRRDQHPRPTGGAARSRAGPGCCSRCIRAIRARVGPDFPLWIRINARRAPQGRRRAFDDQLQVIDLAVAAGHRRRARHRVRRTDVATGPTDSLRAARRRSPLPGLRGRGQVRASTCR